jgi:hypothetical protein
MIGKIFVSLFSVGVILAAVVAVYHYGAPLYAKEETTQLRGTID